MRAAQHIRTSIDNYIVVSNRTESGRRLRAPRLLQMSHTVLMCGPRAARGAIGPPPRFAQTTRRRRSRRYRAVISTVRLAVAARWLRSPAKRTRSLPRRAERRRRDGRRAALQRPDLARVVRRALDSRRGVGRPASPEPSGDLLRSRACRRSLSDGRGTNQARHELEHAFAAATPWAVPPRPSVTWPSMDA